MAMTRGTALVATVARVVQLTGRQDLANLEADGELTLTDLLVTASDAVYDHIDAGPNDPTLLTNEEVYERAVAWYFYATLVLNNYLAPPEGREAPTDAWEWARPHFEAVRGKTTAEDAGRHSGEGVPSIANFESGFVYVDGDHRDVLDWIPGTREKS